MGATQTVGILVGCVWLVGLVHPWSWGEFWNIVEGRVGTFLKSQEVQVDQTLPIGSRESFIRMFLKTILCLVLDFQGSGEKHIIYIWAHAVQPLELSGG